MYKYQLMEEGHYNIYRYLNFGRMTGHTDQAGNLNVVQLT